jgi:GxxExxY protein
MNADQHRLNYLTQTAIGASFEVANALGKGFIEKVYANALVIELAQKGIIALRESPIKVYYKEKVVGEFYADLLIENCLLVETKVTSSINNIHLAQCINYLKATGLGLALLINFGGSGVQVKRVVHNF